MDILSHRSMYRYGLVLCLSLLTVVIFSATAAAQTPVDLNTWSVKGTGSSNWVVDPTGDFVTQTVNGNPTYFVSPNTFFNTTVEGKFEVQTTGDDDYIGFVFGWNEPGDNSTDASFNLLEWKQGNQSSTEQGFRLSQLNGTGNHPFSNAEADSLPNYNVLAINTPGSDPPNGTTENYLDASTPGIDGWADNTTYDFSLLYTANQIKIDIDGGTGPFQGGTTVFDVSPSDVGLTGDFEAGQFGFFNHSQGDVRYESFTLTEPELATDPDDGETLEFLSRFGDSDAQTINVSNTGGAGTSLNVDAGGPTSPVFSGPAETTPLVLTSGDATDFTYNYTPTGRTLGTPDTGTVDIVSTEDGTHTINLSGVAVGPEASFSETPGSTIDFGSILASAMSTITFNIANITTDRNGRTSERTDLTIHDIVVGGSDAAKFSVIGLTPGVVVGKGGDINVTLKFNPNGMVGTFDDASITVLTDQGVAFGGSGGGFSFNLVGESTDGGQTPPPDDDEPVIPEPTTIALLGLGMTALARRRR